MTVGQLIEKLNQFPKDLNVHVMTGYNVSDEPGEIELDNLTPCRIIDVTDGWSDIDSDANNAVWIEICLD